MDNGGDHQQSPSSMNPEQWSTDTDVSEYIQNANPIENESAEYLVPCLEPQCSIKTEDDFDSEMIPVLSPTVTATNNVAQNVDQQQQEEDFCAQTFVQTFLEHLQPDADQASLELDRNCTALIQSTISNEAKVTRRAKPKNPPPSTRVLRKRRKRFVPKKAPKKPKTFESPSWIRPIIQEKPEPKPEKPKRDRPKIEPYSVVDFFGKNGKIFYEVVDKQQTNNPDTDQRATMKMSSELARNFCPRSVIRFLESRVILTKCLPFETLRKIGDRLKQQFKSKTNRLIN